MNFCDHRISVVVQSVHMSVVSQQFPLNRALTPLFGNGAGAHGIGKISCVLTKIGKFDIVLMYDVSIARLIPIIKPSVL